MVADCACTLFRMQYYFISTFVAEHVAFHAKALKGE